MKKIIILLKDPSWWFTVVFVGFFVSIFASYFRERLSHFLSLLSASYKNRLKLKKAEFEKKAQELACDPTLLSLQFSILNLSAILMATSLILFISMPVLAATLTDHPEFSINGGISIGVNRGMIMYWSSMPIGLLGIRLGLLTLTMMKLCFRAKAIYKMSKNKTS